VACAVGRAHVLTLGPQVVIPLPRKARSAGSLRVTKEHCVSFGVDHFWFGHRLRAHILALYPSRIFAPFPRITKPIPLPPLRNNPPKSTRYSRELSKTIAGNMRAGGPVSAIWVHSVPLPRVVETIAVHIVNATEEHHSLANRIVGESVTRSGSRSYVGHLSPFCPVPLPCVAEVCGSGEASEGV
jgi:hypothetical protein